MVAIFTYCQSTGRIWPYTTSAKTQISFLGICFLWKESKFEREKMERAHFHELWKLEKWPKICFQEKKFFCYSWRGVSAIWSLQYAHFLVLGRCTLSNLRLYVREVYLHELLSKQRRNTHCSCDLTMYKKELECGNLMLPVAHSNPNSWFFPTRICGVNVDLKEWTESMFSLQLFE